MSTTISIDLTVVEINVIMGVLGRQPYQDVEALIANIRRQALPQLPPAVAE
jgi:hypothetical protein